MKNFPDPASFSGALLDWYDNGARSLPWRAPPGVPADPYAVWLSEIMLQQTTVATVGPYFERFLSRWPDVGALADADIDDVLGAWAGLGYYARGRNLHKCARVVADELDGEFPDSEQGLRELPGIGPYTAAAIAAIAFGQRAAVIDGNVERVLARVLAHQTPLPKLKKELVEPAWELTPEGRPGDYAQAMMDLGATVCKPRKPLCDLCPVVQMCAGRAAGIANDLPKRTPKKVKPTRHGTTYVIMDSEGAVYLEKRPSSGLLGGMLGTPGSPWSETPTQAAPPIHASWSHSPEVRHTFTHFHLHLEVRVTELSDTTSVPEELIRIEPDDLEQAAIPTVFRKVLKAAWTKG